MSDIVSRTELVDERYMYILQRGNFESLRTIENVAFMINQHLSDKNSSFLETDIFKRILKRAEDAYSENLIMRAGVIHNIFNDKEEVIDFPTHFKFSPYCESFEYYLRS